MALFCNQMLWKMDQDAKIHEEDMDGQIEAKKDNYKMLLDQSNFNV